MTGEKLKTGDVVLVRIPQRPVSRRTVKRIDRLFRYTPLHPVRSTSGRPRWGSALTLALPLAAACIIESGPGPDLGDCAEVPDGSYTYGQVGIGTCLSGPTDLQFFEQNGKTWLAVTNADPFISFTSGSVLLIDFDSIDMTVGRNDLADLRAFAIPTDRYLGGLGYLADSQQLLVSSRYSEDAFTRTNNDEVFILDVSAPETPVFADPATLTVRDDPQPIVVDESTQQAYVLNLTDHSISVVDIGSDPIALIDVAPSAGATPPRFFDEDGSGSFAEMDPVTIEVAADVTNDAWGVYWLEGTYRLWVPEADGLSRWTSGGAEYIPSGFGVELEPASGGATEISDPYVVSSDAGPILYFGDAGTIRFAVSDGTAGGWVFGVTPVFTPDDGHWSLLADSPSLVDVGTELQLFYDGRDTTDGAAAIGRATSTDGVTWNGGDAPVLEAPEGWTSIEDPYVIFDTNAYRYRMWHSLYDGEQWAIGLAESEDGTTWTEPEVVLETSGDVAAPVVQYVNGRYLMWTAARETGADAWSHWVSWSWDGRSWSDPEFAFETPEPGTTSGPPRAAVEVDPTGGWRVEGRDAGQLGGLAVAGNTFLARDDGFSFRVSSGFSIGTRTLGDDASTNGVEPGSYLTVGDSGFLYATVRGTDARRRLAAYRRTATGWTGAGVDLLSAEALGAVDVQAPVAYQTDDGTYHLLVAATDDTGQTRIARAESLDALTWTFAEDVLEPSAPGGWDSSALFPGSIERLDDGTWRLWYTGSNAGRSRIGTAVSTDGLSWTREAAELTEWQFGTGQPADFDDSSVRDPMVVRADGLTHLWYSASDGEVWSIGHAWRADGEETWTRAVNSRTGATVPRLERRLRSFASEGVMKPVLLDVLSDGSLEVLYAGLDGTEDLDGGKRRVGVATATSRDMFAQERFPTIGDRLEFLTYAGSAGTSVIELQQSIDGFDAFGQGSEPLGWGGTSMRLDPERGFLYVTSKLFSYIYVIDVRDDSEGGFIDANYLDIEAILFATSNTGSTGFRDVLPIPGSNLLYATNRRPDSVLAFDLTDLVDDDAKDLLPAQVVGALPVRSLREDQGASTLSAISGAGLALAPEGVLLATHFRDNALYAWDINIGHVGESLRRIGNLGENPHVVRISPDGRYAVVANYSGEVIDNLVSSTLAIVDVDPSSPRYLDVLTWVTNK